MGIATAPPIRLDLALRENDDYVLKLRWVRTDGETLIAITEARLTMRLDPLPAVDDAGDPIPVVPVDVTIAATEPDELGWIDTARYDEGEAVVYISHGIWTAQPERHGIYDAIAVSVEGVQKCLARGELTVEAGVTV